MPLSILTEGTYSVPLQTWTTGAVIASPTLWAVIQWDGMPGTDVEDLASSFLLELPVTVGGGTGATLSINFVVSRFGTPAAGVVGRYRMTELVTTTLSASSSSTIQLQAGHTLAATDTERRISGRFNEAYRASYRDSNGALARTLITVLKVTSGTSSVTVTDASSTLTVNTDSARTGLVGDQYIRDRERGLASGLVLCHNSAREIPRDEAVVDGYSGRLVHPDEYDPPEPRYKRQRPRPMPVPLHRGR